MRHPITAFIALRYLGTKRKNRFASFVSVASIFGISLGVAVLIVVSSVMNGFEKEITRHILGMTSHAMVFKPGTTLDDWRDTLAEIRAFEGVVAGAPFIRAGAMLNHRGVVRGVSIQGIDYATEDAVSELPEAIGRKKYDALFSAPDAILLGETLAKELAIQTDQIITLVAPRWKADRGIEIPRYYRLRVAGTFRVGMHDFDAGFALLSLDNAARIFEFDDRVSGIRLRFTDPDLAPDVATGLADRLGHGVVAVNWTQYHRNFFYALKSQKRMMFIILSLIVAVAAFNIVASMLMIVKEKERDIGILRTLGISRLAVTLIFMFQGVLIGCIGILLGSAMGALGANRADRVVAALERLLDIQFIKPDVYYIDYLPVDMRTDDVAFIALAAFAICVAATLYPAWRAAQTAPAVALRYE